MDGARRGQRPARAFAEQVVRVEEDVVFDVGQLFGRRRRHERGDDGPRAVAFELLNQGQVGPVAGYDDDGAYVRAVVEHLDGIDAELDLGGVALQRGRHKARLDAVEIKATLNVLPVAMHLREVRISGDHRRLCARFFKQIALEFIEQLADEFVRAGARAGPAIEMAEEILVIDEHSGALLCRSRLVGFRIEHGLKCKG